MVGEMSVRGNVLVGKYPVGEVSFGEVSGQGIVRSEKCLSGKCPSGKCQSRICPRGSVSRGSVRLENCPTIILIYNSTGASDRNFYPIFNKRFDHLETLLTICWPKKVLSAGSLCRPLVPSPQSKCLKRTFMLPQKYHVSVSHMLSKPLICSNENEN